MDFSKLTPEQFRIAEMVVAAAEAHKIDPNLLLAQAYQESRLKHIPNPETDAFGVMQIRPGTAEQNNLGDITDLRTNIFGGASLMRQYLDKYKSPEAALLAYHQGPGVADEYIRSGGDLKAVGPNGLDYVIKIGESGGFGQPEKAANTFTDYESESSKLKREQVDKEPTEASPEQDGLSQPAVGAIVGAGVNTLLPMFTNPQVSPRVNTGRAQEANLSAQDKLELARRNLDAGSGDLERDFRRSQGALEALKNEQRLAEARLKAKAPPAMEVPSPQIEVPSRAGGSGAVNWVHSMAEGVPDAAADRALNMRGDNPQGGQAIIDRDMAARQRQAGLGLSDYELARTQGGVQLALPPETVAERQADEQRLARENQAELERKQRVQAQQQAERVRLLEQQRLSQEADLNRIREQKALLGQRHGVLAGQVKEANQMQRAFGKAETDAELASRKLGRAQQQPNVAGRALENVGVGSARMGALPRAGVGAVAGYVGVMSYQEALARYKAGDTSEAVLKALETGAAAAAMVPPVGKTLTKIRGAGLLGLGAGLARDLFKARPPEE